MPYFKLTLQPGIDKQNTEYGAEGGWIDGDYIRFRYGLPEKLGGWKNFETEPVKLIGQVTDLYAFNSLIGTPFLAVGTHKKLYIYTTEAWSDITPIRLTTDPGDVTFAATDQSNIITVTSPNHQALAGDFVIFSGATGLGGEITAAVLNQEFEIQNVNDANNYTILASATADTNDSGDGGASTVGEYQVHIGSDVSYFDFGWGLDTWGASTWGTARDVGPIIQLFPGVWKLDGFGEDVICQIVNGGTYIWDTSAGPNFRATQVPNSPTKSTYALVSTPDRHLVLFGTETTIGNSATQDPMFVRFSNQEDISTFTESATNTAGGQRLSDGNRIISAVRSRGQILIFTNTSLHGMQYVGPPYTFGFQQLGANCGCLGPHAAVDVNGLAFWMGEESFYVFDGTVKKMACTVQDYVFKDINLVQGFKVFAGINSQFNEVTWWYCSFTSDYVDRFVSYNYLENVWSIGSLARTSWSDASVYLNPLASEYDYQSLAPAFPAVNGVTAGRSKIFKHEDGFDANGEPILAYIKSGYFDIGDGDNMLFMSRFIPDFKNQEKNLTVKLLLRPYPQATASPSSLDPYVITPTTQKVDTRARGRQISLQIESDELGSNWRFGTLRVDIKPDGLR